MESITENIFRDFKKLNALYDTKRMPGSSGYVCYNQSCNNQNPATIPSTDAGFNN